MKITYQPKNFQRMNKSANNFQKCNRNYNLQPK